MRELMTDKNAAVRLYGRLFIGAATGDLDEAFSALMKAGEMHSWTYVIG